MKRPVTMYAESTPNPATMKFVADVMLVTDGNTAARSPGHFGHIELARPVFYIQYLSTIFLQVD